MPRKPRKAAPILCTIGHSTRSLEEFVGILQAHGIQAIADVRTVPRSRRVPQFNAETLPRDLSAAGIEYFHLATLGGLRKTHADSPNGAWRNASFRGYADYMQTADFAAGVEELIAIASERPTAIMCAEAVPWRCHRSLIGDAMLVRGWQVMDLMTAKSAKPHNLTGFAKVRESASRIQRCRVGALEARKPRRPWEGVPSATLDFIGRYGGYWGKKDKFRWPSSRMSHAWSKGHFANPVRYVVCCAGFVIS